MDLTASSAVNFPINSASLRLGVIWMGVGQSAARIQGREYRHGYSYNKFDVFHGCFLLARVRNKREAR